MGSARRRGRAFVVTAAVMTAGCGQSAVERGFDVMTLGVVAGTQGVSPVGAALAVAPDGRAAAFVADSAPGAGPGAWRIVMPESGQVLEPGASDVVREMLDQGQQMVPSTAHWVAPRQLQVCTDYAMVLSLDLDEPKPAWDRAPGSGGSGRSRGSCRQAEGTAPSEGTVVRTEATPGGDVTVRRASDGAVLATLRAPMLRSLRAIRLAERTADPQSAVLTLEEVLGGFSSRRHTFVMIPGASGTSGAPALFFTRPALFQARVSAGPRGPEVWGLARCGEGEWCLWRGAVGS